MAEFSPPKALVFDLGKVLLEFDYAIASRRFAQKSNADWQKVGEIISSTTLLYRFETGQLNTQEFFDELSRATGYRGTLAEFEEIFSAIFSPMPDMIRLQADIRAAGLPCYIFSNTNELAIEYIRRTYPFFANFDGYVLSYEHGSMKPESRLYEVVESMTGRRGEDLLYIDDRPENIAAGAERGWQTILQERPEATRLQVAARGIPLH